MPSPNASPSPSGGEALDSDFMASTAWVPSQISEDGAAGEVPNGDATQPMGVMIPPELVAEALGGTFQVLFGIIAEKRGDHWHLKPFEKSGLVASWTPLTQYLLSKLSSSEQGMFALALMTTAAVVGGKVAQDGTKRASSTANIKTPESAASPASSVSATPAKPPEPNSLSEAHAD